MQINPVNLKITFNSTKVLDNPVASHPHKRLNPTPTVSHIPRVNMYARNLSVLKNHVSSSRTASLAPITSKQEYYVALNKLYHTTYYACGRERDFFDDSGYENVEDELKALALYCGLNDKSFLINSWLSGRKKDEIYKSLSEDKIINALRAFEYSLKVLDKKFGKFSGTVYRRGFFNPNTDKQYYSSSDRMLCANAFSHHADSAEFKPFSIIRVKNGHRIFDFQNYANSSISKNFEKVEHEVLLDRLSKYRKVPPSEFTKQDIKTIKTILKKSYGYKPWQLDLDKLDKKIGLYDKFMVWEEI